MSVILTINILIIIIKFSSIHNHPYRNVSIIILHTWIFNVKQNYNKNKPNIMLKMMHRIAWDVFCLIIVFADILSFDKKFILCKITLIPPKPISPLAKIVFTSKDAEVVDRFNIPDVISNKPIIIDTTTLWYSFNLNTLHIVSAKMLNKFSWDIISINKKLMEMYAPTIKTDINES